MYIMLVALWSFGADCIAGSGDGDEVDCDGGGSCGDGNQGGDGAVYDGNDKRILL